MVVDDDRPALPAALLPGSSAALATRARTLLDSLRSHSPATRG
jgi:hypothetical protein